MASRVKVELRARKMADSIRRNKITIDTSKPTILNFQGKKYIMEKETHKKIDNVEHSDKIVFKEFDEEEYKDNLNIIIDAIAEKTAKKELIRELVKNTDMKSLRRLANRVRSGKLIKKQKGCLGFRFGNDAYLQLVE